VAVVAYYYLYVAPEASKKTTIGVEDLKHAGRQAGRGIGTRPIMTLNNAYQQGYLDRAEKGKFALNAVGQNLVVMTLGAEGSKAKPTAPRRRARRSSPRMPRSKPGK